MNLRKTICKLQTALCIAGRPIKINQLQQYSEKNRRMVTKYMLMERRDINGITKYVTLLETYQQAEVVQALAELYKGGG